jgi:hypothetical protein
MENQDTQTLPWFQTYRPLIVIITTLVLAAWALRHTGLGFMYSFMGLFFVVFAMFKLLDVAGFAKSFSGYDLVARRFPAYAYAYPWIELVLGLAYLDYWHPPLINLLTLALMALGAAGIATSLSDGRKLPCACLGTALNVPLGAVSIVENVGMGTMAAIMLIVK